MRAVCSVIALLLLNGCDDVRDRRGSDVLPSQADGPNSPLTVSPSETKAEMGRQAAVLSEGSATPERPTLKERNIEQESNAHPAAIAAKKRLGEELVVVLADPEAAKSLIKSRWVEALKVLPDRPLKSSSESDVSAGKRLPSECFEILRSRGEFTSHLFKGSDAKGKASDEIAAAAMILTLTPGLAEDLPQLILDSGVGMPPTDAVLIVFTAALTGVSHTPPVMNEIKGWQGLALSQNPLWRFLALRAARQGVWNPQDGGLQIAFAKLYANETDPTIVTELAQMLENVPAASALQYLETLLQSVVAKGDPDLNAAIENSIRHWVKLNGVRGE